MKIKGQLSKEDFVDFQRLHLRQSKVIGCFAVYLAAVFIFAVAYLLVVGVTNLVGLSYVIPILFFAVLILLFWFIFLPRKWKQVFEQNKELNLPFELELNDDEMVFTNELSKSRRPWKNFRNWKDDSKLILLYHAENMATMLPKRLFTGEEIGFIYSKIKSHDIPRDKLLLKKPVNIVYILIFIVILLLIVYSIYSYMKFSNY